MAETVEIRIFECRRCGRRTTWLHDEMPAPAEIDWKDGECAARPDRRPCSLRIRAANIAAADLRYLKRFGRRTRPNGPETDVTDYT